MDDEHGACSPGASRCARCKLDSPAGATMRELRTRQGMTQATIAGKMAESGFHWHQTTVVRIEGGVQRLEFAEAEALAEIFDSPLCLFLAREEAAS